jgi:uncharacterized integral membrane protein
VSPAKTRKDTETTQSELDLMEKRPDMRKKIVALGVIILIAGFLILVFPSFNTSTTSVDVYTWTIPKNILTPLNFTFYLQSMSPGYWFKLNVLSTDMVQLDISILSQSGQVNTPIFSQQGTSFTQKVTTATTGTYDVNITNTSTSTVTLSGNVVAQRPEASARIINQYAFPGFLVMLIGTTIVAFGIFRKPRAYMKTRRDKRSSS